MRDERARRTTARILAGVLTLAASGLLMPGWVSVAAAADAPATTAPLTGGLLQAVLGLAIVLALIWGAAWAMRRLQPHTAGSHGALKLVAAQSVGQRERIVVIEVAEQWLVVGVAPGSVNALATMPKGSVPELAATPNAFATLLQRARGHRDPT